MAKQDISIWKKMPFVKLLLPLMAGIAIQWYLQVSMLFWLCVLTGSVIGYISFFFLPLFKRYKFASLSGLTIAFTVASIGATLVSVNDIRTDNGWFVKLSSNNSAFVVTLTENPVEKAKSFKANAVVDYVEDNGKKYSSSGKLILYFSKDSFP